ncbi:hypothetical protein MUK42_21037 [Musa troglodytarum]|uniref:Transcription repressor n=1 Tax=Musa troglodytarum TaxID=320322 RepID=A0A9E7FZS3_9LILI|nr:hypothetical protein MUK42_21037 [Musa troglodytarum]
MGKSNNKSSSSSSNAKFKHRFSRMLLGSSCTTTTLGQAKLPSATPQRLESELFADPDCRRRRKLDHHAPFSATDHRRLRHVAPVVSISINCGARRSVQTSDRFLHSVNKEEDHDDERTTEAKQRSTRASETKKKTKRAEAKKLLPDDYGFIISSSIDNENQLDLFSSDEEEEESATLLSSNSFSSDSSEFYHNSTKKNTKSTRRPARRHAKHSKELRPLVSISSREKEESRESNAGFAVVKRSSDPYSDFKSSMVEMIVERGMHRARDLERLLDAYLSLNSHRHHQAILEAFADICEAMYGK